MARFGKFFCFAVCACLLLTLTAARRRASDETDSSTDKKAVSAAATSGTIIFDMNTSAGWDAYTDNSVTTKLGTAAAKTGKALEITYSMNSGGWLGVRKQVPVDLSKFTGLRFTYKGEGSKNSLEVKFEDADGSNFGYLVETKSNPDTWTTVEMPFADLKYWWGGDQTLDLKKIMLHFAVSKKVDEDQGGSGKILIGSVQAYGSGGSEMLKGQAAAAVPAVAAPAAASAMPEGIIDNMKSSPASWNKYTDNSVTVNMLAAAGQSGKALELDYNMNQGTWLGIWRQVSGDISKYKGIRVAVRGEGSANSIEFKIECADGSNFGKVLAVKSNVGGWTTVEIPFTDLPYLWGGSKVFSLANPKVHFAVSKKGDDDQAGAGKFFIGPVELYK